MSNGAAFAVVRQAEIDRNPVLDDALHALVEKWLHHPYSYLRETSCRSRSAYVVDALRKGQKNGAISFVARKGKELAAILQIETLGWDSDVIGFPIARISWMIDRLGAEESLSIRTELLGRAVEEAQKCGTRYLLARVPANDIQAIHMFEKDGFQLLEGLLTYGISLEGDIPFIDKRNEWRCRPFSSEDLPVLRELAARGFSMDRFHADPAIEKAKADEIHRRWIENSCEGFADCVMVSESSHPVGFTTLKIDSASESHLGVRVGVVVLVATSSEHRRRGVAQMLTLSALRWFKQAGCQWVEVGTQMANIDASRVYQSAGFRLVRSSLTFRKLL